MTSTVPERTTKRADELIPGDWIGPNEGAYDFQGLGPCEVLFVKPYTSTAGSENVYLTVLEAARPAPQTVRTEASEQVFLLSPAALAEVEKQAERAKFISGLREFADWLEANPWAPTMRDGGYFQHSRLQIDLHGEDDAATLETIARVRDFAERMGVKVDDHLDDRTDASLEIGSVAYSVIAWHRNGRPARPGTTCEEIEDEVADLGWPAEAVDALHAEALTEDNDRAQAAIVADLRVGEHGRVTSLRLARYLAEGQETRREARLLACEDMAPGHQPHDGHRYPCCGKVGRISAHRPGCPVSEAR